MLARRELILAVAVAMTLASGNRKSVAGLPGKTLVFEGTVTSIGIVDNERKPWLITVKVTRVVAGEFSGSTFEFVVHSPARSGLEMGHSYTIEAVWNGKGYIVDENQWLRRRQVERGSRSREPSNVPLQSDGCIGRSAPSRTRR